MVRINISPRYVTDLTPYPVILEGLKGEGLENTYGGGIGMKLDGNQISYFKS